MRKGFLNFLVSEGCIPPERASGFQETLRAAPEPIGAIAFSYGMITGGDIDDILDEQRRTHQPFGEIAVDKGLLSRQQVETLLQVQRVRTVIQTAEALALAGICPLAEVMMQLGRFLASEHSSLPTVR